jgi:Raf kinase inhibitor-like YbhB/YbcL family protein
LGITLTRGKHRGKGDARSRRTPTREKRPRMEAAGMRSGLSISLLSSVALLCVAGGCTGTEEKPAHKTDEKKEESMVTIQVTSPAFKEGETIPERYTCEGDDLSPPLVWSQPPEGTKSLAMICEDPDAPRGMWVHWVLYGLPPDSTSLPEAVPPDTVLANQVVQGKNDWGRIGYGGPCPPPGSAHRYFFKLYALDADLELQPGATRKELLQEMEGHMLAEGQLMGRYKR